MANAITLAQLGGDYLPQILSNTYQNATATATAVNELYKELDGIFYTGTPDALVIADYPTTGLNHDAYLWLQDTIKQLQDAVNGLISQFNANGMVGPPNYTDTPLISLWWPLVLGMADYQPNINQNWQTLENALNACYLYIAPYVTEGVS